MTFRFFFNFFVEFCIFSAKFWWIVFPDFAPNSRKEWGLSLFNQFCENELENYRNFWKFWKFWKLFNFFWKLLKKKEREKGKKNQFYSILFNRVLTPNLWVGGLPLLRRPRRAGQRGATARRRPELSFPMRRLLQILRRAYILLIFHAKATRIS